MLVSKNEFPLSACFRLPDFRYYVKQLHEIPKKHDSCLLILTYNSIASIKELMECVRDTAIDIMVIDNNSTDGTFDYLRNELPDRINILQLHSNGGCAGGYAVGQEWVLGRFYKYCLISEDDAIPMNNDMISAMLQEASEDVVVQSRYDGLPGQLFTLHFVLYPCRLFEKAGVINANFFYRYEDYEYGLRLQKAATELGMEAICIERKYCHPYLKQGFGVMPVYFMVRNGLIIFSSLGKIGTPLKVILSNMTFAVYTWLNNGESRLLSMLFLAIRHFLVFNKKNNQGIINKFRGIEIRPRFKINLIKCSPQDFVDRFTGYAIKTKLLNELPSFFQNMKPGKGFEKIILGKYAMQASIWSGVAAKAVFIEEIDLTNKSVSYWEYTNTSRFTGTIKFFVSVAAGGLITILLTPFILAGNLYYYSKARKFYPYPFFNRLFSRSWNTGLRNA